MTFNKWLNVLIEEKGIDLEDSFTVEGPSGVNYMQYVHVVAAMQNAPIHEQMAIKSMLVKIDFRNGDIRHYLRHLAQAIAL